MRLLLILSAAVALAGMPLSRAAEELPRTAEYDYDVPVAGSYSLPVIKVAADGQVVDSTGRSMRLNEVTRGKITVLSFIYTRCAAAKACPYATGVLNRLHRISEEDAELARGMRLVSMSFDPSNDTPERMAAYSAWAGHRAKSAEWKFLTTRNPKDLQPILVAFGQAVDKRENPNDPLGPLNHTLRVYLIDSRGNIRNIYSSGTLDPRLVVADVRTLIQENERESRTASAR